MRNCVKYVRSSRSHIGNCDYYQWQSRCQSTWTICYTSLSYVGLSTSQLRAAIFRRDGASLRVAPIYYVAALRCVSVRIFLWDQSFTCHLYLKHLFAWLCVTICATHANLRQRRSAVQAEYQNTTVWLHTMCHGAAWITLRDNRGWDGCGECALCTLYA